MTCQYCKTTSSICPHEVIIYNKTMKEEIQSASYGLDDRTDIYGNKVEETKTALEHFAKWLRYVPKDTVIEVTQSEKTIVFIRTDIE